VSVATPDFAHKEPVLSMLRAGKHVLVEKPMATDSKDAEQMVKTAKKKKLLIMTDFHNRFNPPFVLTKEKIDRNELGSIVSMYAKMGDKISVPLKWFKWSGKSGPHWFLFPHVIDLVCWLNNSFPKTAYARGIKKVLKSRGVDCYDVVSAILDFGASYAVVETSWIIPDRWTSLVEFYVGVQTTSGKVNIEAANQGIMAASDSKQYLEVPFYTGNTYVHNQNFGFMHLPIRHLVDCVSGNREPLIKPEDGLNNVRIIEAIDKSIKKSVPVDIRY